MNDQEYKEFLADLNADNVLGLEAFIAAYDGQDEPFFIKERIDMLRCRAKELDVSNTRFNDLYAGFKEGLQQQRRKTREEQKNQERTVRSRYEPPPVDWMHGELLDEPLFISEFNEIRGLRCVNGRFYTVGGGYQPDDQILNEIQDQITPYYQANIARKARDLMAALKNYTYTEAPAPQCDRIHVKNGYVELSTGRRVPVYEFTFYRMAVDYDKDAPAPELWLRYLADLLDPEDIPTFQEFLGYCMIPTTKAQKMLYLLGNGGEGKSLAGTVLKALFGDSMTVGTLHMLEDRFGMAEVEGKLLFLDDDLRTEALRESANVKTLVTATTPVRMERKGKQAYQALVFCRLLAFGNQLPDTVFDHTDGAYRRRLILTAKPKAEGREDDPNLADKIIQNELPGVFNWMLKGLNRLLGNHYRFTISEAARKNAEEMKKDAYSPAAFLTDPAAVRLGDMTKATATNELYACYCQWCEDNLLLKVSARSFSTYVKAQSARLPIRHSHNLPGRVRGYYGIEILWPRKTAEPTPFEHKNWYR